MSLKRCRKMLKIYARQVVSSVEELIVQVRLQDTPAELLFIVQGNELLLFARNCFSTRMQPRNLFLLVRGLSPFLGLLQYRHLRTGQVYFFIYFTYSLIYRFHCVNVLLLLIRWKKKMYLYFRSIESALTFDVFLPKTTYVTRLLDS